MHASRLNVNSGENSFLLRFYVSLRWFLKGISLIKELLCFNLLPAIREYVFHFDVPQLMLPASVSINFNSFVSFFLVLPTGKQPIDAGGSRSFINKIGDYSGTQNKESKCWRKGFEKPENILLGALFLIENRKALEHRCFSSFKEKTGRGWGIGRI